MVACFSWSSVITTGELLRRVDEFPCFGAIVIVAALALLTFFEFELLIDELSKFWVELFDDPLLNMLEPPMLLFSVLLVLIAALLWRRASCVKLLRAERPKSGKKLFSALEELVSAVLSTVSIVLSTLSKSYFAVMLSHFGKEL